MDVVHLLIGVVDIPQISIIAAATLPEAVMSITIRLDICRVAEVVRCVRTDPEQGLLGYR